MSAQQLERVATAPAVLGDMGYSTLPAGLTPPEELAYRRGFDRADRAYLKASGGPGVVHDGDAPAPGTAARRMLAKTLEANGRAYRIARHDKCHAGGMSAVRAYLRKTGQMYRIEELAPVQGARKTRRAPAVPVPVPVPVETPAPVVKLRKGSKLVPCPGHARYWESLTPTDRFKNACEGGNGDSACTGGQCTLTAGTDRYTADLAARGPVPLSELNGVPVEPLEPATPVDMTSTPASLPDPLPSQTWHARKQSRRELAAAMRAMGLQPAGQAWELAKRGTPLADILAMVTA